MKKLFAVFLIILVLVCLSVPVMAEETETVPPVEETEGQKFDAEFFNNTVMPLLVSVGSSVVGLLAVFAPYLKKSAKFNKLHGIYLKQKEENETLQGLLNATDINQFKDAVYQVLTEDVRKALANVKIDNALVADIIAQMDLMREQIQTLIRGATNAWAQSPAAVACLASSPTESAVRKQAIYITNLEDYIKQSKGEEAEALLADLKGV